jgi:hypothetical protein
LAASTTSIRDSVAPSVERRLTDASRATPCGTSGRWPTSMPARSRTLAPS